MVNIQKCLTSSEMSLTSKDISKGLLQRLLDSFNSADFHVKDLSVSKEQVIDLEEMIIGS